MRAARADSATTWEDGWPGARQRGRPPSAALALRHENNAAGVAEKRRPTPSRGRLSSFFPVGRYRVWCTQRRPRCHLGCCGTRHGCPHSPTYERCGCRNVLHCLDVLRGASAAGPGARQGLVPCWLFPLRMAYKYHGQIPCLKLGSRYERHLASLVILGFPLTYLAATTSTTLKREIVHAVTPLSLSSISKPAKRF